jgi:hypothetical protein
VVVNVGLGEFCRNEANVQFWWWWPTNPDFGVRAEWFVCVGPDELNLHQRGKSTHSVMVPKAHRDPDSWPGIRFFSSWLCRPEHQRGAEDWRRSTPPSRHRHHCAPVFKDHLGIIVAVARTVLDRRHHLIIVVIAPLSSRYILPLSSSYLAIIVAIAMNLADQPDLLVIVVIAPLS